MHVPHPCMLMPFDGHGKVLTVPWPCTVLNPRCMHSHGVRPRRSGALAPGTGIKAALARSRARTLPPRIPPPPHTHTPRLRLAPAQHASPRAYAPTSSHCERACLQVHQGSNPSPAPPPHTLTNVDAKGT